MVSSRTENRKKAWKNVKSVEKRGFFNYFKNNFGAHPSIEYHLNFYLSKRVVQDGLVRDQVQEVDAVLIEGEDVLAALHRVSVPPHGEETGAEELPLRQSLQHLGLGLAGGQVLHLGPAALHHVHPLGRLDVAGGQGRLGQQELRLLINVNSQTWRRTEIKLVKTSFVYIVITFSVGTWSISAALWSSAATFATCTHSEIQ